MHRVMWTFARMASYNIYAPPCLQSYYLIHLVLEQCLPMSSNNNYELYLVRLPLAEVMRVLVYGCVGIVVLV